MGRRALAALLVISACTSCSGGHTAAKPPTASVTATTLSAVEREVEAAYLKSWDVYADAMLRLTTDRLSESYAEAQLERTASDVRERIADGRPARMSVDHRYSIKLVSRSVAEVRDRYRNHSVILDPKTRQPAEPDPNSANDDLFTLKEISGAWKVIHIQQLLS